MAPPIPQHLSIHSRVLNEDREVWVRAPPGYQASKDAYPVLYQTDAPQHVNEIGSIINFLVTSKSHAAGNLGGHRGTQIAIAI